MPHTAQVELPFYEGPEAALMAAVQQLGGAKAVASKLWPDKTPEAARTRLLDALNPSRAERLDLSEAMFVLRAAKDAGLHGPMTWICGEIGYEARPVTKAEEMDRVTTVIEQSTNTLAKALQVLERMQRARAAA